MKSKNNHLVRNHAFRCRHDTPDELQLPNRLRKPVPPHLNLFTPTKKPAGYTSTAAGRRKRIYNTPATPRQHRPASGILDAHHLSNVATRIEDINPAELTRQINTTQLQLPDLANTNTQALAATRHIDPQA